MTAIDNDKMDILRNMFETNGFDIRVVGGAVRDYLCGKTPKDIDLATTATPDQVTAIATAAGLNVIPTGIEHGTVTVVIDHEPFEITTLRVDTDTDGRHAVVQFTTDWAKDAARRDLTINAMSMDFNGNLYDYFGGRNDLDRRIVRFVGNAEDRIKEDYLRILRFFRFVDKINGKPDQSALDAIGKLYQNIPVAISGERIWMEMSKIIAGANAVETIRLMEQVMDLSVFGITNTEVDFNGAISAPTRLALMSDNSSAFESWKPSSDELDMFRLVHTVADMTLDQILDYLLIQTKPVEPYVGALAALKRVDDLMAVLKFDVDRKPFPVNGHDLMAIGLKGPAIGTMRVNLMRQWFADGFTASKDDLITMAQNMM